MSPDRISTLLTLTRDNVVASAREYMGVPFRHQGRNALGIDCVGLVLLTAKNVGACEQDFDYADYPRRSPHSEAFMDVFKEKLVQVSTSSLKKGDVVALREPIFPCHCGIIGERFGELTLIHAFAPYKKVTEGFWFAEGWDKKLVAVFEFPNIEEAP